MCVRLTVLVRSLPLDCDVMLGLTQYHGQSHWFEMQKWVSNSDTADAPVGFSPSGCCLGEPGGNPIAPKWLGPLFPLNSDCLKDEVLVKTARSCYQFK